MNYLSEEKFDVAVIGGGASGMMAAISAFRNGYKKICIIEKNNTLGNKLKITGGGRCNITNDEDDIHKFLSVYGTDSCFLYSSFSQFNKDDTFKFFENLGLPLVVEARKRVFPKTQKAEDVFKVLEKEIYKNGVSVFKETTVKNIILKDGEIKEIQTTKGRLLAHKYILSTGGLSHKETGSTGDGFLWLEKMGHNVVSPTPSLVPVSVKEKYIHSLSGTSLSFMKITFFLDNKKVFSKTGKILFTHFGLSGPLILNSSFKVKEILDKGFVTASIDMYPDTDFKSLDLFIRDTFDKNKNKIFKNIIKDITPEGMQDVILYLLSNDIDPYEKINNITKEQRQKITNILKSFSMTISGIMGYDRAIIADGGIPLGEIDTKTMRSKKVANLYVTGDLLNVYRMSGGYSLQMCWTSGFIAGKLL